jgi:2'-5' RNA ligase
MKCDPIDADRINLFALVSYIPNRLGEFLDRLRKELVAGCNPHAHVTVLPPRPLYVDPQMSMRSIETNLDGFSPFQVEIEGIQVFKETNVVYAALGRGRKELEELHRVLNTGPVRFEEPHKYHPHVTLAQGVDPAIVPEIFELASRRWKESAPARSFAVDTLTFVQNTAANDWIDLMQFELTAVRARR